MRSPSPNQVSQFCVTQAARHDLCHIPWFCVSGRAREGSIDVEPRSHGALGRKGAGTAKFNFASPDTHGALRDRSRHS